MSDMQIAGSVPAGAAAYPAAGAALQGVPSNPVPSAAAGETSAGRAPGTDPAAGPDPAGPGGAAAGAMDPNKVRSAVADANHALAAIGTQLVFVFDNQAHHMTVKLLDIQTQKVVQEVPTQAMPAAASTLSGPSISGALVDTAA
jgi:hypothetical protein